jgi:hypothetical protein
LDRFAKTWLEVGDGVAPTGDALSDARALTSTHRVKCALATCVELGSAGHPKPAAIYRALATIMMETLHPRAGIGSGGQRPPDDIRAFFAQASKPNRLVEGALKLFDELVREVVGIVKPTANSGDELARVIERIRGLRAKTTQQGRTEQEALRAAEKVSELLERYGISLSEIEMRKQTCEGFRVETGRRQREPHDRCVPGIADFCDCRVWSEGNSDETLRYVYFGLPADIEAARYLHDLVAAAFATEPEAFRRSEIYRGAQASGRRAALSSFQIGLATGISDKLAKLKAQRLATARKSSGRDLMLVKKSILDEELERLGLEFRAKKSKRRRKIVSAAYAEGEAAAGRFKINPEIR